MTILKIVTYPDPVLSTACKPVEKVTKEIQALLTDLADTMYEAPGHGIGLAAPQVGVLKRVIVLDTQWKEEKTVKKKGRLYQLVNPVITKKTGALEWDEGCLSIPGFSQMMKRAKQVTVEALDYNGKPITIEAEDLFAVCLQHEIDHLDGKLIIDKASRLKKNLYIEQVRKTISKDHKEAIL
ncbi:MAG: peptide deformylase [Deltaproteobacteria bacterium]|nr:peptide deformylase [Deltaproteobacteria bacterium]